MIILGIPLVASRGTRRYPAWRNPTRVTKIIRASGELRHSAPQKGAIYADVRRLRAGHQGRLLTPASHGGGCLPCFAEFGCWPPRGGADPATSVSGAAA